MCRLDRIGSFLSFGSIKHANYQSEADGAESQAKQAQKQAVLELLLKEFCDAIAKSKNAEPGKRQSEEDEASHSNFVARLRSSGGLQFHAARMLPETADLVNYKFMAHLERDFSTTIWAVFSGGM